jgi:hypothetical protein
MVDSFNNLQTAQSQTADDMADLETNFSESMAQIEADMEDAVEKMNMEDDASTAAKATMQAYIDAITAMKGSAISAAESVAQATANALNTTTSVSVPGHAGGTTDSERVYVAGEEGPELILSGGGDTVFPAAETEKIISAVSDNEEKSDNPQIGYMPVNTSTPVMRASDDISSSKEKTITLRLEGSGSIGVNKDTSVESVWDNIKDNLKSTFMSILQEEMYEEGAGVYEF